jgi:hypothetical protein
MLIRQWVSSDTRRPKTLRSTVRAACHPHMPCTPGPGGVDAEQRKMSPAGVVHGFHRVTGLV